MEQNELKLSAHHTAISVSNLEQSIEWYQTKLGFAPVKTFERPDLGARIALMSLGSYFMEIFCFEHHKPLPDERKTLAEDLHTLGTKHLALGVQDIDNAYRILENRGVQFEGPPSVGASKHRYAFFKDLDGILIELFEINEYKGD